MSDAAVQVDMFARGNEFMEENIQISVLDDSLPTNDIMAGEPNSGLIHSIQEHGVLVPVLVVAVDGAPFKYMVKDGRRRVKACRKLHEAGVEGYSTIPCRVIYGDENSLAWASSVNNIRSDNPLSDLEVINNAMEVYNLHEGIPADMKRLAEVTGIPPMTLKKRMKMLKMPVEFIQAAYDKKLPIGELEKIAGLSTYAQGNLLNTLKNEGKITGSDVSEAKSNQINTAVAQMQFDALGDIDGDYQEEVPEEPIETKIALWADNLGAAIASEDFTIAANVLMDMRDFLE